jgi:coenzyme Q-binding protein COQ10
MPSHRASRILPWSCEQLFDLAADVENYPAYLPGWVSARVIERTDKRLRVEQQLGLKLLRQPFVSTAELERPGSIDLQLNSSFLEPMVNSLFNLAATDIISRFEIRAHTVYEHKPE